MFKQLIAIALLTPATLSAQQKGFVINGKVSGLADNSAVSLTDANKPTDTLAKGRVQKGVFVLKGTIADPNLHQLNYDGASKKSVLFIGNETITVTGDVANVQEIKVTGSPTHNDFLDFQKIFNPLFQDLTILNQKIGQAQQTGQPADSLMLVYQDTFKKLLETIPKFETEKRNSPVAPFMMVVTLQIEQDPARLEQRYKALPPASQQGFYGQIIKEKIESGKIAAVGTDAIEFSQNDTTGKPVSLASFRGKYVLVDFWASWCKPCRVENPNVVAAFNKFNAKNFTVLGVSLDKDKDSWIRAINDDQLAWTQVSDLKFWANDAARLYKIEAIPQNILIDPQGKIVGKNLRGEALQTKLCELLGCN